LSFAIDAWSSPNYKAFVAITVNLMHDGELLRLVLDVIELAKSHTGRNMAEAFTKVLEAFGITAKVSQQQLFILKSTHLLSRYWPSPLTTCQPTM
jgi:hypothetical protein